MSDRQTNDQVRIGDSGELEIVPLTWDGEPLYSPATVAERLFTLEPFAQLAGQTSMETDNSAEAVDARREMFRGFGWNVS